jgi:hypothetical protein
LHKSIKITESLLLLHLFLKQQWLQPLLLVQAMDNTVGVDHAIDVSVKDTARWVHKVMLLVV